MAEKIGIVRKERKTMRIAKGKGGKERRGGKKKKEERQNPPLNSTPLRPQFPCDPTPPNSREG